MAKVIVGKREGPQCHLELFETLVVFQAQLDGCLVQWTGIEIVLGITRWSHAHEVPGFFQERLIELAFGQEEVVLGCFEIFH